jgi:NifU-like protein
MPLSSLITPFPWARYSKKLIAKIDHPRSAGFFSYDDAASRKMHLAEGKEGKIEDGNAVKFYWLVDPTDGIIVDAKFQAFGQSALIGAAEVACELIVGKNYDQAKRVSADLIDRQVRDKPDIPAFPKDTAPHLNLVIGAIDFAAEQCVGIPLPEAYVAPPMPIDFGEAIEGGIPNWNELSIKQKIAVIEQVLDRDVRPYIALDEGGVEVLNLLNDRDVIISYKGSCTSCVSSVGATLAYIQQVIRNKVHPDLTVAPDLDPNHPFKNLFT